MILHVVPEFDSDLHLLAFNCKCRPQVWDGKNGMMVVHNAYDRRESLERESRPTGKKWRVEEAKESN